MQFKDPVSFEIKFVIMLSDGQINFKAFLKKMRNFSLKQSLPLFIFDRYLKIEKKMVR